MRHPRLRNSSFPLSPAGERGPRSGTPGVRGTRTPLRCALTFLRKSYRVSDEDESLARIYPLPATHLSGQTRDVLATLGPYSWSHAIGLQCFNNVPTDFLLLIVQKGVGFRFLFGTRGARRACVA